MAFERFETANRQTESQKSQFLALESEAVQMGAAPTSMLKRNEDARAAEQKLSADTASLVKNGILPDLQLHDHVKPQSAEGAHRISNGDVFHRHTEELSLAKAKLNPAVTRHR